jgi:hypothetical protein
MTTLITIASMPDKAGVYPWMRRYTKRRIGKRR